MWLAIYIVVLIVVGLLILRNPKNSVPGCTCKHTMFSQYLDYGCPVCGDWQGPIDEVGEIKADGDKEKANVAAGLEVNKLLKDKWNRE